MLKKLKKIMGVALLAIAGLSFTQGANAATLTYTQGDVLMGFFATGGASGTTSSYILNLGQFTTYRDALSTFNVSGLGNVGADLTATFGSDWNTSGNIVWGVIAATGNTVDSGTNTVYAGSTSTGWTRLSNSNQIAVNTALNGVQLNFAGRTSTANSNVGLVEDDSEASPVWKDQANASLAFTKYDTTLFNGLVSQNLNFYRMVKSGTDDGTGATTGLGSFEGYFAINGSGQISFNTVPEPSTYALLGLGLGALVLVRRFRSKQATA
jgi:hypothetical protein